MIQTSFREKTLQNTYSENGQMIIDGCVQLLKALKIIMHYMWVGITVPSRNIAYSQLAILHYS